MNVYPFRYQWTDNNEGTAFLSSSNDEFFGDMKIVKKWVHVKGL